MVFAMLNITPSAAQKTTSPRSARKVEFSSRASSKRSSEEVEVEKLETLPKAQEIECLGGCSRNVKCWIILLYWMIWLYDTDILWLYYDILWLYCYLELSHLDLLADTGWCGYMIYGGTVCRDGYYQKIWSHLESLMFIYIAYHSVV